MESMLLNPAQAPRSAWAIITTPAETGGNFRQEATWEGEGGRKFRAVRCRTRGDVTTFRVHADMQGDELIGGRLIDTPHDHAGQALTLHPWTLDNHLALLPGLVAQREGTLLTGRTPRHVGLVEQSPAHQRWHVRQGIPEWGVWMYAWVDLHHLDPVGRFFACLAWSDRNDPEHQADFDGFSLISGEPIFLDFATREQFASPFPVPDSDAWYTMFSGPVTLGEGEGWLLGGQMLCTPDDQADPDADPEDITNATTRSILSLSAAAEAGRIRGCLTDEAWQGHWTASRHTPAQNFDVVESADRERGRFLRHMETPGGYRSRRVLGNQESPGQTGDQRDFGTTNGTHALAGMVDMLDAYKHTAQAEAMRGVLHFEDDGTPIKADEHPDWLTWEGRTHWSSSASPDRLGKRKVAWPVIPGWKGYPRTHRSQNALVADMWLDDDPAVEHYRKHMLTTDLCDIRVRAGQRSIARSEGRVLGTFAHFVRISDGAERDQWLWLMADLAGKQATNPTMRADLAMPVLGFIGPDQRKPIRDPDTGELMPTVSVWEHGLAAMGMALASKSTTDADVHTVFHRVLEFVATWGCFQHTDGTWWLVDDLAYFGGNELPGGLHLESPWLNDPRQGGGVTLWTLYGVACAAKFLPEGSGLKAKAQTCVQALLSDQPSDIRDAEWRAVLGF